MRSCVNTVEDAIINRLDAEDARAYNRRKERLENKPSIAVTKTNVTEIYNQVLNFLRKRNWKDTIDNLKLFGNESDIDIINIINKYVEITGKTKRGELFEILTIDDLKYMNK